MRKDNVVLEKSYALALRMVKLYKYLMDEKKEFVLSKQILRSGIEEMLKLLGSIQKTMKQKIRNTQSKLRMKNYELGGKNEEKE